MTLNIVRRPAGADCASILAELPEWFGIPASNADYADHAERAPTWVAEADGRAQGVITLVDNGFASLEIYLLAVRPDLHRKGVGRVLVEQAWAEARALGKSYVMVKTQGPSAGYQTYARTRAFYEALGFEGLEELTAIWGPENPCLIMVMRTPG